MQLYSLSCVRVRIAIFFFFPLEMDWQIAKKTISIVASGEISVFSYINFFFAHQLVFNHVHLMKFSQLSSLLNYTGRPSIDVFGFLFIVQRCTHIHLITCTRAHTQKLTV